MHRVLKSYKEGFVLITALVIICIYYQQNWGGISVHTLIVTDVQLLHSAWKEAYDQNNFQALIWNARFWEIGCASAWVMVIKIRQVWSRPTHHLSDEVDWIGR